MEYQKHIEVKRIYEKNLLRGFESLSIHREGGYFPPLRVFLTIPCFIITVGIVRSSLIGERHLSHIFLYSLSPLEAMAPVEEAMQM